MKKKYPPKLIGEQWRTHWILRLRVGQSSLVVAAEVDSEFARQFDTRASCVRAAKRLAEALGVEWEVAE